MRLNLSMNRKLLEGSNPLPIASSEADLSIHELLELCPTQAAKGPLWTEGESIQPRRSGPFLASDEH